MAHQAPLSMGFSRQVYWSGLPYSPPGDISDPRIKPMSLRSPTLAGRFFTTAPPRKTGEYDISSVQSLSPVYLFVTPWAGAHKASLSISNSLSVTNSKSLLKLMSIKSVTPSNHLILCHPFLLPPSIIPSIRVFSNESALCIRWPKYWSFSFSISPFNEISGVISLWMDWFDLLLVQGTLKSIFQHHGSKASSLWCLAFFILQFSHPYMTTGKIIALTRGTFVGKVMSLLFNILSMLVIAFLPRNKCLNFMAAVTICSDSGAQENKVCLCFHCFPIYLPLCDGTRCHDLSFLNVEFRPAFSLSSLPFIKRLFSSSLSAIRVVSSAYLRLLIFLLAILIPDFASSSLAISMMDSACKLSKQELLTIYSLDILLSQFGTSLLFHVQL